MSKMALECFEQKLAKSTQIDNFSENSRSNRATFYRPSQIPYIIFTTIFTEKHFNEYANTIEKYK